MNLIFIAFFLLFAPLLFELSFPSAFAYIDPGSGSVIIQMLIGALVGIGITFKVFWFKIKSKFTFNRQTSDD